jgi:hypothetical protein
MLWSGDIAMWSARPSQTGVVAATRRGLALNGSLTIPSFAPMLRRSASSIVRPLIGWGTRLV